jgi:hypothetical protein
MRQAMPGWENLGDAHFYASSGEHWAEHGENRWNEIYPIALNSERGMTMAFPAPAYPIVISWWVRLGLSPPMATLLSSGLALMGTLCLFYFWALKHGHSIISIWAIGLCPLFFGKSIELALSGGSDSLGQFGLVCSLLLLLAHDQKRLNRSRLLLLFSSAILALIRPHNQILLLLLGPTLLLMEWRGARWLALAQWALAMTFWKLIQISLISGGEVTFPYSFSFLVSTPSYPDHSLFRHYFSEGFSLPLLLEHLQDLQAKALKGWGLIKMYWSGWFPQVVILGTSFFLSKKKFPILLVSALLGASLFLSASGHLVPRYWTILIPMSLLMTLAAIRKENFLMGKAGICCLFLVLIVSDQGPGRDLLFSPLPKRELNLPPFPNKWVDELKSSTLVSCDHPSKAIDALGRPLLLLPQNPTQLRKIEADHGAIQHLLLSPDFRSGELTHWEQHFSFLEEEGFKISLAEGWTLFTRSSKDGTL